MLSFFMLFAQEAEKKAQDGPPGYMHFLPIIVIGVVMFWMMSRMKKKEQQQREQLLSQLKKNDKVLTSGGIIGIVAALKENDDEVTLKVDESSNVRLRVLRSAIVRIYGPETSEKDQKEGTGA